jgi:hypothetical protein
MKRRKFLASTVLATTAIVSNAAAVGKTDAFAQKQFYEWREYEIHFGSNQRIFHEYLEKALIPALNKYGVKHVGVFRELGKSEPPRIFVLIPYASAEEWVTITQKVNTDSSFLANSEAYRQVAADKPLYNRFTTSLMTAFDGMPAAVIPANEPRIFELRTYEGYNEEAVRRKVKMFNESEFDIFRKTKLNAVFFGELVAGKNLPALSYMLTFKNMEERDANWKAFGADPDWKKISADPQYANTVSNIIRTFLEPVAYSQF